MTNSHPIPVKTMAEISEERINVTIQVELGLLVDQGLLNMSIDPDTEEAVYWPTPLGCRVLGMESEPEDLPLTS